MKTTIATLAAAVLTTSVLHAQIAPAPSVEIKFTEKNVKIDGRLDDIAWQDAATITLDRTYDGKPSTSLSTVKLMWDKNWLYLGAVMPDQRVVAGKLPRDGFLWEKDDVLELFLWPNTAKPYYYEIVVNPKGTLYDAFFVANAAHNSPEMTLPDWNPDIRVQTRLAPMLYRPDRIGAPDDKGFWSVEMAIPIASMGSRGTMVPGAGESWRAQLNRYNRPDPGPGALDATSWTQYDRLGEPHLLNTFGTFVLTGGPTPVVGPVVPESNVVPAPVPVTPAPVTPAPVTPAPVPVTPTPDLVPAPVTPTPDLVPAPVTPTPDPVPAPVTPAPDPAPAPVTPDADSAPKLLSLNVTDMPLRDALDLLFEGTNRSYILTPAAAQASPTVTLNVQDKTFEQALLQLVNAAKLLYKVDKATGVYTIDTPDAGGAATPPVPEPAPNVPLGM